VLAIRPCKCPVTGHGYSSLASRLAYTCPGRASGKELNSPTPRVFTLPTHPFCTKPLCPALTDPCPFSSSLGGSLLSKPAIGECISTLIYPPWFARGKGSGAQLPLHPLQALSVKEAKRPTFRVCHSASECRPRYCPRTLDVSNRDADKGAWPLVCCRQIARLSSLAVASVLCYGSS